MRVIAGTARGRTLAGPPPGSATRPTTDKVREALFNILGDVSDLRVLDLFAGTGALGIEALSRGAAHVTFVESERRLCDVIHRNLATVSLGKRATVVPRDVRRAALSEAGPFELVFADPPYQLGHELAVLEILAVDGTLSPEALVVIEHSSRDRIELTEVLAAHYSVEQTRVYGDTALTWYRAPGASSEPPP